MSLFILDGHAVIPAPDPELWMEWIEDADRIIREFMSFTPTRVWKLTTYFVGTDIRPEEGGCYFFASMYQREPTMELLDQVGRMQLSVDWTAAEIEHERLKALLLSNQEPVWRGPTW